MEADVVYAGSGVQLERIPKPLRKLFEELRCDGCTNTVTAICENYETAVGAAGRSESVLVVLCPQCLETGAIDAGSSLVVVANDLLTSQLVAKYRAGMN